MSYKIISNKREAKISKMREFKAKRLKMFNSCEIIQFKNLLNFSCLNNASLDDK